MENVLIKYIGVHTRSRKIKITINKKDYYVGNWAFWFSIDPCTDEVMDFERKIAIENLFWLIGLDEDYECGPDTPKSKCQTMEELYSDVICQLDHIFNTEKYLSLDEYEYLKENIISDYYSHRNDYRKFVDINELYQSGYE